MKPVSKSIILRILSVMLCIALLMTSGTVAVLATTVPSLIQESVHTNSLALPENMALGVAEAALPENAEELLSKLSEYDSFTDEEKRAVLAILLPGYNETESDLMANQAIAEITRDIEKMPASAKAEMKIHCYMEAGKDFSDLDEMERKTLLDYLEIRADALDTVTQYFAELENQGVNLFDSMLVVQMTADGLFTLSEAIVLVDRYDSRMERDSEVEAFRDFVSNFEKPTEVTAASLMNGSVTRMVSEKAEELRDAKSEYLSAEAFHQAKQLFMNGTGMDKIRAAYSVGAALNMSPASLVEERGVVSSGSISMSSGVAGLVEQPALSDGFYTLFPVDLVAVSAQLQVNKNATVTMGADNASAPITTEEALLMAATEMQSELYSSATFKAFNESDIVNPPFLADLSNEAGVSLNTGASYHDVSLVNIPGVNGMDLELGLSYSSERANLYEGVPNSVNVTHYYACISDALYAVVGSTEILYNKSSILHEVASISAGQTYISNVVGLLDGTTGTLQTPYVASKAVSEIRTYNRTITGTYSPFSITGETVGAVPSYIQYSDMDGYSGIMFPYYDGFRLQGNMVQTGSNTWSMTTTVLVQYSGQATCTTSAGVYRIRDAYVTAAVGYSMAYDAITYPEQRCNIGSGWMWNLPSIEIVPDVPLFTNMGCLHLPDRGKVYFQNIDFENMGYDIYNHGLKDLALTTDQTYTNSQGYTSYYKLTYLDGSRIYFAADGRVLAEMDRFGNTVSYMYNTSGYITGITDGYHTIQISYVDTSTSRTITITTPDGNSHILNLTLNPISPMGDWLLSSIQYPDGTVETYSYSSQDAYINAQSQIPSQGIGLPYALLTQVTYPTGASLVYTYGDKATTRFNTVGCKELWRVTERKWVASGTEYNKQTYTYNGEYTNFPQITASLPDTFTYSVTVGENNGSYAVYTFGNSQQPISKITYDANGVLYETETWSYNDAGLAEYHSTGYPTAYGDMISGERWVYDDYGRVNIYYLPLAAGNEHQYNISTQYVYSDAFSKFIPQYIAYQTGMSVRYETRHTLTADGLNIALVEVLDNTQLPVSITSYQYDAYGRVQNEFDYTTTTTNTQKNYVYAGPYLSASGTLSVMDADGNTTFLIQDSYTYDSMGRVTSATDGNGATTFTMYDNMGRVTAIITPEGRSVSYTYDPILNTVLTASGSDAPVLTAYNAFGLVVSESIPSLNRTLKTYSYDTRLRLVQESNASGQTSSGTTVYTYDSLDRPTSMVRRNASGAEIYRETFTYDRISDSYRNDVRTIVGTTGAPSITTVKQYTVWGDTQSELTKHADGNYYGRSFTYDNTGRVCGIQQNIPTNPGTMSTQYALDYYGNILTAQDAVGQLETNLYDLLGRLTNKILPANGSYAYVYDALNRLTTEITQGTSFQSNKYYYYDNAGHLIREKITNNSYGDSTLTYREQSYAYDADGNLTDTVIWSDAFTGSYTHYEYDMNGRMIAQYAGMTQPYSPAMTAADYQLTEYVYNNLGQLTALIDPMGGIESYAYDANGNLITTVMRDGKVNRITYNALGSVVTDNVYADSISTTPLSAKSYTYYPTGAVKSVTEDGTTTTYTYDERGNVLTETTGTTVNAYTYDHCNNRISHTLTVGGAVISAESYAYDQRCRLISVTGAQGMTLYGYDLSNARTAEYTLTADGASVIMSTGYTYAAPGLVSVCRGVNRNSEPMVHFEYTYYADGNLRTETDYVKNQITTYTYDNAGRLETEISPAGSYSYTYDAAGNRATMTENGTTTTYTYDKNNRLLRESKPGSIITYTYDANGNLLTGDGATYTYDTRNRQVGYVKGSDFATYTYYPSGLRKTKTTALAISNYIWDGSNMICEYASSATSGKVYTYGHTLISQGNSWYYLYNAHGDVVKYINANGAVLKSYDYDAFGEEADPSTTDANPFRYAGQYFDDETGTYYLRARYYNPGNGRFTQQDSWGYADPEDPLSLNLYVYCYGNPLMFVDINGHWPTWSQIGTALLIGVAAVATAAAVVATAGAAGAAIGYAAGFYLGVSASTAATITTVATGAAYVVAGANIVVGANDINEVFTGHNIIRDDLMGGNQALYADAKLALAIGSASIIQIGVDYTIANATSHSGGTPYQQKRFRGDSAVDHFKKHGQQVKNALNREQYTLKDYIDDANFVIQNGTYIEEKNAYVYYASRTNYAYVGLDSSGQYITTFHIKGVDKLGYPFQYD